MEDYACYTMMQDDEFDILSEPMQTVGSFVKSRVSTLNGLIRLVFIMIHMCT